MSLSDQKHGIYLGNRGIDFQNFISKCVRLGGVNEKYVKLLTSSESMKIFASAFTSELVDSVHNYQYLEQLGDLSGNKIIVSYMYEKFPFLRNADGVKVAARLRIIYGSKQCFSEFARKLGFWSFISATNELRQRKMKPLLEDVFEAFLGAVESILDEYKRPGFGYAVVYDILSSILDDIDISLKYEDLYDSKTRLKELFDTHENSLGPLLYKEKKQEQFTLSTVFRVNNCKYEEKPDGTYNKNNIISGQYIKIGEGFATLKADAQQNAAKNAIINLAKQGWTKQAPEFYQNFLTENHPVDILNSEKIKVLWGDNINEMQSTKDKTKYQNKYESTPIALYNRIRNINGVVECLKRNADLNITDTDCLYPLDLLFIGKTDIDTVKSIISIILEHKRDYKIKIHSQVFDMYYVLYKLDDYFNQIINKLDIVNSFI